MNYFKEYEFDKSDLPQSDIEAVSLMKEMLMLVAEIYAGQINKEFIGSNYYPYDATKEEVLKAAETNNEILSPYTVVKRDANGSLIAVPYKQEYAEKLGKIADLAVKAAALATEKQLKGYLERLAVACKDDSWEELENYWLVTNGNKLDLQLAPIEPYIDGLLNIKHGFQGTLRITSKQTGFNPQDYIQTIKAIKMTTLPKNEDGVEHDATLRIDDVIASAGHQGLVPARGSNYPNDRDKAIKYGTKLMIYTNNIREREEKELMPLLKKIVRPEVFGSFTPEEYFSACIRSVLAHEIAEAYIKYPNTAQRLKAMYLPVRELHSSLMGMKIAAHHVLHGAISSKDYEAMLLVRFIGRAFSDFYRNEDPQKYSKGIEHYIRGYTIALNYFLRNGAISLDSNGFIDIDYSKMFAAIDQLAGELSIIKRSGTEADAKKLFEEFEDYSFYENFRDKILA